MADDPGGRREAEMLRSELMRERARLRELEAAHSTLASGLEAVREDLVRVERSRAWRFGHAVMRAAAKLSRRRTHTRGAVASALARVERLQRALPSGDGAAGARVRASTAARRQRVPQTRPATDLADLLRAHLGEPARPEQAPAVSAVVVTRDGRELLERLLPGLAATPGLAEIIVVDNASSDGTVQWLDGQPLDVPIRLHVNATNVPFGEACNQGASLATAAHLLFLNNDVEVVRPDWLAEMLEAIERGADAVGALLVHGAQTDPAASSGWIVQHAGITFRALWGVPRAHNAGDGDDLVASGVLGHERTVPAATAACLLIRREAFEAAGCFPAGYLWGSEDVELGLRLIAGGRTVRCTTRAVVLHHESTSQAGAGREFRRLNWEHNRRLFMSRWGPRIRREHRLAALRGDRMWTDERPHIAITLTDDDPAAGWGDYYTAHEMGEALEAIGWRVTYAPRRGDGWYELGPGVGYALVLLDAFDTRRIDPGIVRIGWLRNWTERWLERPWFWDLDVLLASSRRTQALIEERTGRPAAIFPLATNPDRFRPDVPAREQADYVFTGSRFGEQRSFEGLRTRDRERFAIYGKGWEAVDHLRRFHRGHAPYESLAAIYSGAKLVIDDTASPTLPYGAVNSRVFDALAAGTLPVSNCLAGVHELFDDDFPTWCDAGDLRDALDRLLADDGLRERLTARYREQVLGRHTYAHRARELHRIVASAEQALSFCIRIGAPDRAVAQRWGDLHFAESVARELVRRGHRCLIQTLDEWEDEQGLAYDVAITLRGLSQPLLAPGQFNVLWNISHPDDVAVAECEAYDLVLVASPPCAERFRTAVRTPVVALEQATDPRVFFPEPSDDYRHDVVYVGNSRGVLRKALADLLPTDRDLAVWGADWDDLIDARYVKGDHVPNAELRRVYSSAGVVLCDHWEDMREHGFVANRVYDALACGAVIVSDRVAGLERFGEAVVTYETPDELEHVLDALLADPHGRAARGRHGRELVLSAHTFAHRIDALLDAIAVRMHETGHPTRIAPASEPVESFPAPASQAP